MGVVEARMLFIRKAREAVDGWDGCSTAELILDILHATGEDVPEELSDALYKHTHNLYPPGKESL